MGAKDDVLGRALKLPAAERWAVVRALVDSLDEGPKEKSPDVDGGRPPVDAVKVVGRTK